MTSIEDRLRHRDDAVAMGERAARAARAVTERASTEGLVDIAYGWVDTPVGKMLAAATEDGLLRLGFEAERVDLTLEDLARKDEDFDRPGLRAGDPELADSVAAVNLGLKGLVAFGEKRSAVVTATKRESASTYFTSAESCAGRVRTMAWPWSLIAASPSRPSLRRWRLPRLPPRRGWRFPDHRRAVRSSHRERRTARLPRISLRRKR